MFLVIHLQNAHALWFCGCYVLTLKWIICKPAHWQTLQWFQVKDAGRVGPWSNLLCKQIQGLSCDDLSRRWCRHRLSGSFELAQDRWPLTLWCFTCFGLPEVFCDLGSPKLSQRQALSASPRKFLNLHLLIFMTNANLFLPNKAAEQNSFRY